MLKEIKQIDNGMPRFITALAFVGLPLLVALIYAQVLDFEFLAWDDRGYGPRNQNVSRGLGWDGLRWAFSTFALSNWHPLTWLSLQLDATLYGAWSGGFHMTNALLHAANSLLLWEFLRKTLPVPDTSPWPPAGLALAISALFAVHPLHVESVAWVSERKDVLSAFFALLTLMAYRGYVLRPCLTRYLGITVLLSLGLMSKPMIITLPFALLLLDFWPFKRAALARDALPLWLRLIGEKLPWIALGLIFTVITFLAQDKAIHASQSFPERLILACSGVGFYLIKTLAPSDLSFFYTIRESGSALQISVGVGAILSLTWVGWKERCRQPWILSGWLWFLGLLVPVIGLVKIGEQAYADRYTYLPHIGLFWLMGCALAYQTSRRIRYHRHIFWAVVLITVFFSILSWQRAGQWRDSERLFREALRVNPDNEVAHEMLGGVLAEKGRLEEGLLHLRRAEPDRLRAAGIRLQAQGMQALKQGKLEEAETYFLEAEKRGPHVAEIQTMLAWLAMQRHAWDETEVRLQKVISQDPEHSEAQRLLALLRARQGRTDEAIQTLKGIVAKAPDAAEHRLNLARLLYQQGRIELAEQQVRDVLVRYPQHAQAQEFLKQLQMPK